MKLLALDCSTQACSVAVLNDESARQGQVIEHYELAVRSHTERLLPMVDQLLVQTGYSLTQFDAIAFGCGPGSFTGLRICLGAVQGLAFGAQLPVIPVSSLAALAQGVAEKDGLFNQHDSPGYILSTIDARMDEIYWGLYRTSHGLVELVGQERLCVPEQLQLPSLALQHNVVAAGTGFHYGERIACCANVRLLDADLLPRAAAVAQLAQRDMAKGRFCAADKALPVYLRDQVASQK